MNVLLAGYNLDVETINELKNFIDQFVEICDDNKVDAEQKAALVAEAVRLNESNNLTPETLSAAYARISRSPKPVNELREIARREVDKARKSNQNIIFGLGHSSVAEHATFNFDIIGVSRYAVETIEHFRLASYTEKSQRYVLFKDDFVIPEEIDDPALKQKFVQTIRLQNETYLKLYETLRPYFFEKNAELAADKKNHKMIEGWAKEDARYIIALATQTQLGMTVNARTLENMMSKCFASPLAEVREFAQQLYKVTEGIAPSIIKYVQPSDYLKFKKEDIREALAEIPKSQFSAVESDVKLIDHTPDVDDKVLAAILFRAGQGSYKQALEIAGQLSDEKKQQVFQQVFKNINAWDSVLREFEFVDFTFELIVSGGNFGQLKRHRMANIVSQHYAPELGITIPESIVATGQEKLFNDVIAKTNAVYDELSSTYGDTANYVLTNAHRRRVLFKINLRELYHFSRLREDAHAQWDIRQTAEKMHAIVKDKLPLAGAMLGGKDGFGKL